MKNKQQYIFRATEHDQYLFNGIEAVLSDVLEDEDNRRVGPVKCMRFSCKVAEEILINGQLSCPDKFRMPNNTEYKPIKIDLDKYDLARVNAIARGLANLSGRAKAVPRQTVMQVALECAAKWLLQHAEQAERIGNGSLEQLMYYALVHCTKGGPGVGPSKIIKSCVELSKQYERDKSGT